MLVKSTKWYMLKQLISKRVSKIQAYTMSYNQEASIR